MPMLIFWNGWGGIMAPALFMATLILTRVAVDGIWGEGYFSSQVWTWQLGVVLASLAVSGFGLLVNRRRTLLIDEETGSVLDFHPRHSLYFIPVQYWGLIVFGFAAFLYYGQLI